MKVSVLFVLFIDVVYDVVFFGFLDGMIEEEVCRCLMVVLNVIYGYLVVILDWVFQEGVDWVMLEVWCRFELNEMEFDNLLVDLFVCYIVDYLVSMIQVVLWIFGWKIFFELYEDLEFED